MGLKILVKHFSIEHKTGIPYGPQGHGIVECVYGSLKSQLQKIKIGIIPSVATQCLKSYSCYLKAREKCVKGRFWHDSTKVTFAKDRWKDPCTGLWKGPNHVLIWGRRQTCVFPKRRAKQDGFWNV